MKRITKRTQVNLDQEVAAMAAPLATRWEGIPLPLPLLTLVRDQALKASRVQFDCYDAVQALTTRKEQRMAMLAHLHPEEGSLVTLYDRPTQLLTSTIRKLMLVERCAKRLNNEHYY